MSRPLYNGRTAKDWYHIWQEDTEALQKRLLKAQQELDAAEARLQLAEDALAMYQAGAVTHISIRPDPETAFD